MSELRTLALIDDLLTFPAETAWVEFKENNTDPRSIGRLISAISNAARIAGRDFGYVVWGVRDHGHAVVGTRRRQASAAALGVLAVADAAAGCRLLLPAG